MSKPGRFSIRSAVGDEEGPIHSISDDTVKTANDPTVTTAKPTPGKVLKRPPHLSVYVEQRVNKALKEIALARDCKVHDLILEGLDHVLTKHGRSLAELNRKS